MTSAAARTDGDWWRDDPPIDRERLIRAAFAAWFAGEQRTVYRRVVDAIIADLIDQGFTIAADDPSPAATVPESMVLVRREDAQTALVALTRAADNSYDPEGQAWLRAAHGAIEKALRADLAARAEPAKGEM